MEIDRGDLLGKLSQLSLGLQSKGEIEQSTHFVFLEDKLVTFNGDIACFVPFSSGFRGAVLASPLMKLLQKMSEEKIDMSLEDGSLKIEANKRKAGIRLERDIFLPIEGVELPEEWKPLPEGVFPALGLALSCVGRELTQYKLGCVHVHQKYIEACDGFQLLRHRVTWDIQPALLEGRALSRLMGLEFKEYAQTDGWLHFRGAGGSTIACRQQMETEDFSYPSLTGFLKVEGEAIQFPAAMEEAIDRASVFGSQESHGYDAIQVELRRDRVRLSSRNAAGWYQEIQDVQYGGPQLKFSVDAKLLLEIQKRSKDCVISSDKILVSTDMWRYVTSLEPIDG